jgi:DNA polymerase III alpha subunit
MSAYITSNFSPDGVLSPKQALKTFVEENQRRKVVVCADTTLSSAARFSQAGKEFGVKTVVGLRSAGNSGIYYIPDEKVFQRVSRLLRLSPDLFPFDLPEISSFKDTTTKGFSLQPSFRDTSYVSLSDLPVAIASFRKLYPHREYQERLDYELRVISEFKIEWYFAFLYTICNIIRGLDCNIGPGRGSAAGSLVAFALGVTGIDPLIHGLFFERFLNPGRSSLPDIDIDIEHHRRQDVLIAIKEHYGKDNVGLVGSYTTAKAASAILSAARVLGIEREIALGITKTVPSTAGFSSSLEECRDLSGFQWVEFWKNKEWSELALSLESKVTGYGTHAAGVVISQNIVNELPHIPSTNEDIPTLGYDLKDLEYLGYIKFDLLGTKVLSVLSKTARTAVGRNIIRWHKIKGDEAAIRSTWEGPAFGHCQGIFQLSSPGCEKVVQDIKPTNLDELTAILALYRPGPMAAGAHTVFAERGNGWTPTDELEEHLKSTRGLLIYQEQAMSVAVKFCGYSLAQADDLRKATGKKIPAMMDQHRKLFLDAGHEDYFELIAGFAEYSFNLSHARAYAIITLCELIMRMRHTARWLAAYTATRETLELVPFYQDYFSAPNIFFPLTSYEHDFKISIPYNLVPHTTESLRRKVLSGGNLTEKQAEHFRKTDTNSPDYLVRTHGLIPERDRIRNISRTLKPNEIVGYVADITTQSSKRSGNEYSTLYLLSHKKMYQFFISRRNKEDIDLLDWKIKNVLLKIVMNDSLNFIKNIELI